MQFYVRIALDNYLVFHIFTILDWQTNVTIRNIILNDYRLLPALQYCTAAS